MTKIPPEAQPGYDPTIAAMELKIAEIGNAEPPRGYLGAYQIGRECQRELWYSFRWCATVDFDGATHRRFIDGHRDEALMADRLNLVDGVELHPVDPRTGKQFEFNSLGGHFQGHMDGAIKGILQAPNTWHVWEHKTTELQKQLSKAIDNDGEKAALKKWSATYYGQAQTYMHYFGMSRHYLTANSPGGRTTVSVRTDYSRCDAELIMVKAERIIRSDKPLPKLSEKPEFYICKMCDFAQACHKKAISNINCRTCCHATPEIDDSSTPRWTCARFSVDIPLDRQRVGCIDHRFIPALLPFDQVDASAADNWIEYQNGDNRFRNGGVGDYSSAEISKSAIELLGHPEIVAVKINFDAKVI